jgi:pyrimidine-nucleoside phosphorylase
VAAQGGDWAAFEQQAADAARHYRQVEVCAPRAGWIAGINALAVGELACDLGAGRRSKDDVIDPWVGIQCLVKTGEQVAAGQPLARLTVRPDNPRSDSELQRSYLQVVTNAAEPVAPSQVLLATVRSW